MLLPLLRLFPCVGDCCIERDNIGVSVESLEGIRGSVGRLLVVFVVALDV